jgi:hypothetical protein
MERVSLVPFLLGLVSSSAHITDIIELLGNLKISDFGLATVFKYNGRTRLLTDRCGSPPYGASHSYISLAAIGLRY